MKSVWNSMAPMNPHKYAILAFCKNSRQYVTKIDIFLHARLSLSTSESPLDGVVCWAAQTSVQMILGVHQSWVSVDQNSIALARSHTAGRPGDSAKRRQGTHDTIFMYLGRVPAGVRPPAHLSSVPFLSGALLACRKNEAGKRPQKGVNELLLRQSWPADAFKSHTSKRDNAPLTEWVQNRRVHTRL